MLFRSDPIKRVAPFRFRRFLWGEVSLGVSVQFQKEGMVPVGVRTWKNGS